MNYLINFSLKGQQLRHRMVKPFAGRFMSTTDGGVYAAIETDTNVVRKKRVHTPFKFVDHAQIEVRGGKGGNGCISFEVLSPGKKKPQGGNGGNGGSVYMIADKSMTSINLDTFHFNGGNGKHGGGSNMTGKSGADVFVRVPCGVVVTERYGSVASYYDDEADEGDENEAEDYDEVGDMEEADDYDREGSSRSERAEGDEGSRGMRAAATFSATRGGGGFMWEKVKSTHPASAMSDAEFDDEEDEFDDGVTSTERSFELTEHNQIILLCRGGKGGLGNLTSKGSNTRKPTIPGQVVKGAFGEEKSLLLELKLIADVGLVGYPNAGKSTLLKALSNAAPKIADYPFTTLHPNIGTIEYSDGALVTVADIPGLIDGASEDRGLGHEFLKHIERTKLLLYVIDMSGTGNKGNHQSGSSSALHDPLQDFIALRNELALYNPELLHKPSLILANKLDITPRRLVTQRLARTAKSKYGVLDVIYGSASTGQEIGPLAVTLRQVLTDMRRQRTEDAAPKEQ